MAWPQWIDPRTRAPLHEANGALCSDDGASFPVLKGIPRFVPAENYADAFGEQWLRFRKTQLDSHTGQPISRDRLRRCFGDALFESLDGKLVLEAGCGAGRFTEVLLAEGARVVSIDLSAAVEANVLTCPLSDRHVVAQANITELPWEDEQFDVVMCLGVLQHTPSTAASLAALYRHVKPGGHLVIDHYTQTLARYTKIGALALRPLLKRLPSSMRMPATDLLVDAWLPLHRAIAPRSRVGQAVLSRFSPVLAYYHVFPELDEEHQRQFAYLDTHDSLTDWHKHLHTQAELEAMLQDLGGDAIKAWKDGIGVEARARKPALD